MVCCAARYIRYIYNRVILENATVRPWPACTVLHSRLPDLRAWAVYRLGMGARQHHAHMCTVPHWQAGCSSHCPQVRAAALSALARFGAACPELRERVLLLLKRALHDNDDEVGRGGRVVPCVYAVIPHEWLASLWGWSISSGAGAVPLQQARPRPVPPVHSTPPHRIEFPTPHPPPHTHRCATAPRSTCTSCSTRRRAPTAWTRSGASPPARWTMRCRRTWRSPTRSSPLTWCGARAGLGWQMGRGLSGVAAYSCCHGLAAGAASPHPSAAECSPNLSLPSGPTTFCAGERA